LKNIALLISIFLSLFAAGCGIPDHYYLAPVSNVSAQTSNYEVTFWLPDNNARVNITYQKRNPLITGDNISDFFNNYYIFYKIYLSYSNSGSPDENMYDSINKTWSSNYSGLKPLTVATNNMASAVSSTFSSYKFYKIESNGNTLLRSDDLITPLPADRLFYRSPELIDPANQTLNSNADVAAINGGTSGTIYAWVAMYVVHKANNPTTLAEYYSTPAFLGIFLLPGIDDNW
jgi:hypothetical protein